MELGPPTARTANRHKNYVMDPNRRDDDGGSADGRTRLNDVARSRRSGARRNAMDNEDAMGLDRTDV